MTAGFAPELQAALQRARYIYLTTYSQAGKPGTVPTWCWLHEGALYFTTRRASLKAKRIRNGGRVTVNIGRKDGPAFEGGAEWVDDRP
ncbi:MAG: putative PNPOx protein, partial [Candidatus Rokubacteria bacterium]|nr:putative PNPOx protein [Candidatus Rokubacteria bacterium]